MKGLIKDEVSVFNGSNVIGAWLNPSSFMFCFFVIYNVFLLRYRGILFLVWPNKAKNAKL